MNSLNKYIKIFGLLIFGTYLSACSGEVIPEDSSEPSKAHVVELVRVYHRVLRYNCDGLTSDKIEETSGPDKLMEIHPTRSWTQDTIRNSSFYNTTTGSSTSIRDKTIFRIDYDGHWTRMEVRAGLNQINYRFDFTDDVVEEGSRYLDVKYRVEQPEEIIEYRPSEEECEK